MNRVISKSDTEYLKIRKSVNTEKIKKRNKKSFDSRQIYVVCAGVILCLCLCVGNFFLADVNSDWYVALAKPVICPPFVYVYLAYAVGAITFCVCFVCVTVKKSGIILRCEYLFNSFLQVLWTLFFFRLNAVFASLIVVFLLVLQTFFLTVYTKRSVGNKSYFLLLHFLLAIFCLILNYSILVIN